MAYYKLKLLMLDKQINLVLGLLQIRYSLVVILELNGVPEVQIMIIGDE